MAKQYEFYPQSDGKRYHEIHELAKIYMGGFLKPHVGMRNIDFQELYDMFVERQRESIMKTSPNEHFSKAKAFLERLQSEQTYNSFVQDFHIFNRFFPEHVFTMVTAIAFATFNRIEDQKIKMLKNLYYEYVSRGGNTKIIESYYETRHQALRRKYNKDGKDLDKDLKFYMKLERENPKVFEEFKKAAAIRYLAQTDAKSPYEKLDNLVYEYYSRVIEPLHENSAVKTKLASALEPDIASEINQLKLPNAIDELSEIGKIMHIIYDKKDDGRIQNITDYFVGSCQGKFDSSLAQLIIKSKQ